MPRIAEVDGVKINIYFADHNPPHFHALEAERMALITIRDFMVLRGSIRALAAVVVWARANQALLIAEWNRCNPDKPY